MKKSLWLLGVAVAALTSCTQSEVLDVAESSVIGFESHIDKNSRAVTTINNDLLTKFYVYCAKGTKTGVSFAEDTGEHYFNGVEVTKSSDSYSYDHKQWVANKVFRFAAYSNGNATTTGVTLNSGVGGEVWGLNFDEYSVTDKDLIVAIPAEVLTTSDLSNMTTVNLGFGHALARVQFVFFTTIDSGEKLKINEFKFNGIKIADCTVSTTTPSIKWATSGTNDDYIFPAEEVNAGTTSVTFEAYVIPQSNQSLKVETITIETLNASTNEVLGTKTYTNVPLNLTDANHQSWQPGTIYSYQTTLGTESHHIHFSTTVQGWDDPIVGDKTF